MRQAFLKKSPGSDRAAAWFSNHFRPWTRAATFNLSPFKRMKPVASS
jgi:hypothetical protein